MPLPQPAFVAENATNGNYMTLNPIASQPLVALRHPLGLITDASSSMDWRQRQELTVKFKGAPANTTIEVIYTVFAKEGNVVFIDLETGETGVRPVCGIVKFSPPPRRAFWKGRRYAVKFPRSADAILLEVFVLSGDTRRHVSPRNGLLYPEKMVLYASNLRCGYLEGPLRMNEMFGTKFGISNVSIKAVQNLSHRNIEISFPMQLTAEKTQFYKLRIEHANSPHILHVSSAEDSVRHKRLVFNLESPPEFFIRDEQLAFSRPKARAWTENDIWQRCSNVIMRDLSSRRFPVSLNVPGAIVNVGRWTTWCLDFVIQESLSLDFDKFYNSLKDFNVEVKEVLAFEVVNHHVQPVWELVDSADIQGQIHSKSLAQLADSTARALPFDVRYQLESCISTNRFSEYSIKRPFIDKLHHLGSEKTIKILEEVAIQERKYFEPMEIFDSVKPLPSKGNNKDLESTYTFIRSAVITPTTLYVATPTMEISNRVIRQYRQHSDRFLRVRFTDEKPRDRIFPSQRIEQLLKRVRATLSDGIRIGDRHYEFLAFGNSQLREHGAYFFAPTRDISVESIRTWMGNFSDIIQIAKYAARLGQCFSTTRSISTGKVLVEISDKKTDDGKYVFTDGVGLISNGLAVLAALETGIRVVENNPPSVLQFRLGGCKGVLAAWDIPGLEIHVRPSQFKFWASYGYLEVIRWSQFTAAYLNQQVISVLSTLGVQDNVFLQKTRDQISDLTEAMTNPKTALRMLQKEVDSNQITVVLSQMVMDGFHLTKEPFMMSVLHLWRAWNINSLKQKARIRINKGAVLLGCTDETATLRGHFNHLQSRKNRQTDEERFRSASEIFVQLSKGIDGKPEVKLGYMLLARNPSLHPGDIRVVKGVDEPKLHHLKDVVVLPQTGDRDVASMCSGGDLDGDDYLVIWDDELLPRCWNYEPMDYSAPSPKTKPSGVSIEDIQDFFVEYIKNDSLSAIALAHRAQADLSVDGVMDEKCVRLAQLHSQAVDFPKTGQAAIMDPSLIPRRWPHFMERRPEKSYRSRKILGQLYDEVELIKFQADYESPFDNRVLGEFQLDARLLETVSEIKLRWDGSIRRIMIQYEIKSEFEVWSTFVLRHIKTGSNYKFHETIGQLSAALKDVFRNECMRKAGAKHVRDWAKLDPFVVAMYQVTCNEVLRARESWWQHGTAAQEASARDELMPMISFPWLFPECLGRIASRSESSNPTSKKLLTCINQDDAAELASEPKLMTDSRKEGTEKTKRGVIDTKHDSSVADRSGIQVISVLDTVVSSKGTREESCISSHNDIPESTNNEMEVGLPNRNNRIQLRPIARLDR